MTTIAKSATDAWLAATRRALHSPAVASPRGMATREVLGAQTAYPARRCLVADQARGLNYRFMVAEWLWIALGRRDVAGVARFNSQMVRFSDDGLTLAGAYGPRLAPQWAWAVEQLSRDPWTRQAVLEIWTPTPVASKDIPCTLSIQFLRRPAPFEAAHRRRFLETVVTMRSSDVWLGLPYDMFVFGMLAQAMAAVLGDDPGAVRITAGSSHLYEQHWTAAESITHPSRTAACSSGMTNRVRDVGPAVYGFLPDALARRAHMRLDGGDPGPIDGDPWWRRYDQALAAPTSADAWRALCLMGREFHQ